MKNDDLIERLEKEMGLMLEGSRCCLQVKDIREIIEALSPVLLDEVQRALGAIDDERVAAANAGMLKTENEMGFVYDLIERLWGGLSFANRELDKRQRQLDASL